jgi:zinc protease
VKNPRLSLVALVLILSAPFAQGQFSQDINIEYQRYVLDNGLTLLVHEDHKAPIATVNIWYHVGSKNEHEGITGFAHLFEHLMFNGSENYQGEWFLPMEKAGGTDLNGTTWFDRTNYFQTVPVPALDMVLWMESDRMGHFVGAITQEGLDEQRSVVQNEKRQGDNRPYGKAGYIQLEGMFPEGHPYRWSTIGSMEDLSAASLEDVTHWFETYYGASNAVLVVAGDVNPDEVLERVNYYFGDIEPGPALNKPERWIAKRTESSRDRMYDEVSQARITKSWNTPSFGEEDSVYLEIAAEILAGSKNSLLYKRLVYEDQIASSVNAMQLPLEIAGIFEVEAYAKPGIPLSQIEAAINEEMAEFLRRGPTREQLERVKTSYFASLIRGLEKVGGFRGKAQLLATYETYVGDASLYKRDLEIFENANANNVRDAARRWLSNGEHNLEVIPRAKYQVTEEGADRSELPDPGAAPELDFPEIQDYQLENGIRVLQVQRGDLPVVSVSLQFDAGYSADPHDQLGTAGLMSAMLDEGTKNYDALEFSARAEELGAVISTGSSLDTSSVGLSALSVNLEDSLELLKEAILNPSFDESELERVRSNWLDQIAHEKTEPFSLALRNLPPLLYGDNHPYGIPFTGSGTEESISALTADQLRAFHRTWIRPDNAKMVVVGNLSREEVEPLLNEEFGDWDAPDIERPSKDLFHVDPIEETVIYLMDKPGSPQSLVIGGHLLPPNQDEDREELDMAVRILGGNFNARLNMNLREDKGWAYGARASASSAVGQRPLIYYAPVQIDRTVDSLREIIREANAYIGETPANIEELSRSKDGILRSLPGRYETNGSVAGTLQDILMYDRPLDYIDRYQNELESMSLDDVQQAANAYLMPGKTIWLVVGDLSEIEQPLREAGIADVRVIEN